MSNKVYDVVKWVLLTFVPALVYLITSLSDVYNFNADVIIQTISIIATFAGLLVGISSAKYKKKNNKGE